MFFGLLIFARILFVACVVFIIGYIYGPFSQRRGLTIAARIAAIAIIFAFIMMNIFAMRSSRGRWQHDDPSHGRHWEHCEDHPEKAESKP
ncbi:hypothetical protein [Dyadobacter sp. MSC1_007]|jgi:uncharacterized membrane protein|uniref:hypothetical protein n=1 Tax=Dyadobacter sp. MSC1_007 TaxID=2909264 RepID=UPI00202F2F89|nr:hypothetical protein [Dyadobacter sp. MSC1_007]